MPSAGIGPTGESAPAGRASTAAGASPTRVWVTASGVVPAGAPAGTPSKCDCVKEGSSVENTTSG